MRTVSASEANQQFSRLLAAVETGEEVVITRRDKPVARLVKSDAVDQQAEQERRIAAFRESIARAEKRGSVIAHDWTRDSLYEDDPRDQQ